MKFRLEKAEEGVPLAQIPIGHIAQYQGIDKGCSAKVLRTHLGAVNLDGWGYFSLRDRHAEDRDYIDLGPLGLLEPSPKRVQFADIPMGHVGVSAGLRVLRTSDGGVFLQNESLGRHQPLTEFGMLYEDLGKLVVEGD